MRNGVNLFLRGIIMKNSAIFHRRILDKEVSRLSVDNIPGYNEKARIIEDWAYSIKRGIVNSSKEESLSGDFLHDIFSTVLEYKSKIGNDTWNIDIEKKTLADGSKSDGVLGFFTNDNEDVRTAVELKGPGIDLDKKQKRERNLTPVEQAFLYASKFEGKCRWFIVSNFKEIRLYNYNSLSRFESFYIENLIEQEKFLRFYFLLNCENLIKKIGKSRTDSLFEQSRERQENISKQFYNKYKTGRIELFRHIKEKNPGYDELTLLEKTQKILDRFIFISFCEDRGLLPVETIKKVIKTASGSFTFGDNIWREMKGLFHCIDHGNMKHRIYGFDGGLFREDRILDSLVIGDEILSGLAEISHYDFDSDLDVNILGHIFEQSISDIEELKAEIKGEETNRKKGKRKREGIFYTPEFITGYIVENAVGGWLSERRKELGENDLPDYEGLKTKKERKQSIRKCMEFQQKYLDILKNLKILDPACGSGAFLVQAFDFLKKEGMEVNRKLESLRIDLESDNNEKEEEIPGFLKKRKTREKRYIPGQLEFFDWNIHILKNNLFGVDLNRESVEITKLSLWLKTADKLHELTYLDDNIKCGNSLIDDPGVAGDLAFDWNREFPEIMKSGGFDVVIGNPPYGSSLCRETNGYMKDKYPMVNDYESFQYFIVLAINRLKQCGVCSLIVPNTMILNVMADNFRKSVMKSGHISDVTDLTGIQVFEEPGVRCLIFRFVKSKENESMISYKVADIEGNKLKIQYEKEIDPEKIKDGNHWTKYIHSEASEEIILEKICNNTIKLEEISDSKQGYIPYRLTTLEKKFGKEKALEIKEKRIWNSKKPFTSDNFRELKGMDVARYNLQWSGWFVKYGEWVSSYVDLDYFSGTRILVREITSKLPHCLLSSFTNETYIHNPSVLNIIPKDKNFSVYYILCMINSSLMSYYFRKVSPKSEKGLFPKIIIRDIREFPIKKISLEEQQPYVKNAQEMTRLQNKLCKKVKSMLDFIKSEFALKRISRKMKKLHELTPGEFLSELKKLSAFKGDKKTLSLRKKEEIFNWFEERKYESDSIREKINRIDRETDLMVYELYKLEEEEIKLIETYFEV